MRQSAVLYSPAQAHAVFNAIWAAVKPSLADGKRLIVEVKPETRSLEQNAKFHAICTDLSRSSVEWAGKRRTSAQWKVLLVSGHAVATKAGAEIVPGLEGEFVNIRESTALMTKARGSSLIEYSIAFCVNNDVELREYGARFHTEAEVV